VWQHLLSGRKEEAAFILSRVTEVEGAPQFVGEDLYLVPPHELLAHGAYHIALTDEAQEKIIKLAWKRRLALVELHSHVGDWPAAFSPSDLSGLSDFAPHVVWRLRQPYLAMVVASSTFDALVWSSRDSPPTSLDAIVVDVVRFRPTELTIRLLPRGDDRA